MQARDWSAYVEVVADGVDLLAGPLAEPVAPHLVQHLVHLPLLSSSPPRIRAPSPPRAASNRPDSVWIAGIGGSDGVESAAATYRTLSKLYSDDEASRAAVSGRYRGCARGVWTWAYASRSMMR